MVVFLLVVSTLILVNLLLLIFSINSVDKTKGTQKKYYLSPQKEENLTTVPGLKNLKEAG